MGRVPRFRPPLALPLTRGQRGRCPPLHLCPARPTPLSVHPGTFPVPWGILVEANALPECQALLRSHARPPIHLGNKRNVEKWLCWRLCYFFLGLSRLHYKVRRKINVVQGTSQPASALGLQYMFPGLQLVQLRESLVLSLNRPTGLRIIR